MNLPWKNHSERKSLNMLLGLAFDGNRVEAVLVKRQNGTLTVGSSLRTTLTLDLLTNDPELVGRELQNHLEHACTWERNCAVAIPLSWVLTAHTQIPAMPESDLASFLALEAERGFPCDPATLRVVTSISTLPSGERQATFLGIPLNHLERLEKVLRAARLKPVSFSLGTTALQPPASEGVLALVLGESAVALQITCGGGVAALRTIEGGVETDTDGPSANADLILREIRITLGQLSPACHAMVGQTRVFGPANLARELVDEIGPRLRSLGMNVEVNSSDDVSLASQVASHFLSGAATTLEFLPPKIPAWKQLATQYSSGRFQTAGMVAGVLVLLVAGAFGIQQWQLFRLTSRWDKMSATVNDLQAVQAQIRQYRPWYDDSYRCLTIMKELTAVFPEDGSVTAKTLEIRDENTVSCSGTARDNAALLKTLSQLRTVDGVHDVKLEQIRGKSPLQFTFGFQYGSEVAHEN